MNKGILSAVLGLVVAGAAATAQAAFTYKLTEVWTGDEKWSSTPLPHCGCDRDINAIDCLAEEFQSAVDLGDVCYDEYIPSGSGGWVHGLVFKRQQ